MLIRSATHGGSAGNARHFLALVEFCNRQTPLRTDDGGTLDRLNEYAAVVRESLVATNATDISVPPIVLSVAQSQAELRGYDPHRLFQ